MSLGGSRGAALALALVVAGRGAIVKVKVKVIPTSRHVTSRHVRSGQFTSSTKRVRILFVAGRRPTPLFFFQE